MLAGDSKYLIPSWEGTSYFYLPVWQSVFSVMCLHVTEGNMQLDCQKNHVVPWLQNEARHGFGHLLDHSRPS